MEKTHDMPKKTLIRNNTYVIISIYSFIHLFALKTLFFYLGNSVNIKKQQKMLFNL